MKEISNTKLESLLVDAAPISSAFGGDDADLAQKAMRRHYQRQKLRKFGAACVVGLVFAAVGLFFAHSGDERRTTAESAIATHGRPDPEKLKREITDLKREIEKQRLAIDQLTEKVRAYRRELGDPVDEFFTPEELCRLEWEKTAAIFLCRAEQLRTTNRTTEARREYEMIVTNYAESRAAKTAADFLHEDH